MPTKPRLDVSPISAHLRLARWRLIEQLAFRAATTMGHVPHEYTTRDRTDDAREAAYVGLFDVIQAKGDRAPPRPGETTLYPGDGYEYWAMTEVERKRCFGGTL